MQLTKDHISSLLPKRPRDANKGTFGKVLVIAGSENYPGAAYLCCAAAYRVGAGLVSLATTPEVKIIVSRKLPEVTFLTFDEALEKISKAFLRIKDYDVLLLGPGLGQSVSTTKLVKELIGQKLPKTVIDGDGLNLLSKINNWWTKFDGEVVLTPHPGEMSRLTSLTIEEIQSNRENTAKSFAKKWGMVVVLKGANTAVASPTGEVGISPFANPALATAGTGDILSGIIAGLASQGLSNFDASCCGVYIHGLIGEMSKEKIGEAGVIASDLLPFLPKAITKIKTT